MQRSFIFTCGFVLLCAGCVYDYQVLPDNFASIQKQTFNKYCTGSCHAGEFFEAKALLSLQPDSAYNQLLYNHPLQNTAKISQYPALVVPFHPDSSYLVFKLILPDNNVIDGDYMPNNNSGHLPQAQIDAIISWIRRGAPND